MIKNEIIKQIESDEKIIKDIVASMQKESRMLELLYASKITNVKMMLENDIDYMNIIGFVKNYVFTDTLDSEKSDRLNMLFDRAVNSFHVNFIRATADCNKNGDPYAYSIEFGFRSKRYSLKVPIIENIDVDNFGKTNFGKYTLFHIEDDGTTYNQIETSYEFDDIRKRLDNLEETESN